MKYRKFFENDTGLLTTSLRTKYELSICQKKKPKKNKYKKVLSMGMVEVMNLGEVVL